MVKKVGKLFLPSHSSKTGLLWQQISGFRQENVGPFVSEPQNLLESERLCI